MTGVTVVRCLLDVICDKEYLEGREIVGDYFSGSVKEKNV